jgi:hypothetical protein
VEWPTSRCDFATRTINRQRLMLGIGLFALIPVATLVPALTTLAGVDVLL